MNEVFQKLYMHKKEGLRTTKEQKVTKKNF